jgi:hypothetical protein
MGVTYHSLIKTAVLAKEVYWLAEKENFKQNFQQTISFAPYSGEKNRVFFW